MTWLCLPSGGFAGGCAPPAWAFRPRLPMRWRTCGRRALPARLKPVQRTDHAPPAAVEHVRVDHGGAYVGVAKQLLHGADVIARFEHVRRKRVPKRVRRGRLVDTGIAHRLAHGALKRLIAHVVATYAATPGIVREAI